MLKYFILIFLLFHNSLGCFPSSPCASHLMKLRDNPLFDLLFKNPISFPGKLFIKPVVIEENGQDQNGNAYYKKIIDVKGIGVHSTNKELENMIADRMAKQQDYLLASEEIDSLNNRLNQENGLISKMLNLAAVGSNNNNYNNNINSMNSKELEDEIVESLSNPEFEWVNEHQNSIVDALEHKQQEQQVEKAKIPQKKYEHDMNQQKEDEITDIIREIFQHPEEHPQQLLNQPPKTNEDQLKERVEKQEEEFVDKIVKKNSPSSLSDRQMQILNSFADYQHNGQYEIIDSSYIFIELDKAINEDTARNLLDYIRDLFHLPTDFYKDLRVKRNAILFKFDPNSKEISSSDLANKILKSESDILHAKGLKIVSCGIGKENHKVYYGKQLLNINSKSENFVIITIVSCLSVLLVVILLACVFLIRRRVHLRRKLAEDVGLGKKILKKTPIDDEENLIKNEKAQSTSWFSFLPFIRRSARTQPTSSDASPNQQDYQELCRQRMNTKGKNANNSSLNDTPATTASGMLSNTNSVINTTPIRVTSSVGDGKSESNRSSTSS